jgi:Rod binding domain-containing protein
MNGPAPIAMAPAELASAARSQGFQRPADRERITKAAQEFEGMLMEQLMQGLRKTVEPGGLFGKEDQSRSTFEYLMDQAVIAKAVQGGKGLGLAVQMERLWAEKDRQVVLPLGNP